jgi:hypothetical protein
MLRSCPETGIRSVGAGLRAVQAMLGHTDLGMIEVYTHVSVAHLQDAHSRHPRARLGDPRFLGREPSCELGPVEGRPASSRSRRPRRDAPARQTRRRRSRSGARTRRAGSDPGGSSPAAAGPRRHEPQGPASARREEGRGRDRSPELPCSRRDHISESGSPRVGAAGRVGSAVDSSVSAYITSAGAPLNLRNRRARRREMGTTERLRPSFR